MQSQTAEPPAILVVDDEPMITQLLGAVLRKAGYSVLATGDANVALEICQKHDPGIALAIIDYIMPEQNGSQLAASLRALHPEMRIMMMSGYSEDGRWRQDLPYDVAGFLPKPFSVDAAVKAVRSALQGAKNCNLRAAT